MLKVPEAKPNQDSLRNKQDSQKKPYIFRRVDDDIKTIVDPLNNKQEADIM
jgi:hypothetical protein